MKEKYLWRRGQNVSDDKIAAILVCDPLEFEPEFLSLVVSPEFEGQGIAGGLLDFGIWRGMSGF